MFDVVPQNVLMPNSNQQGLTDRQTHCPKGLCHGPCSDTLEGRCGTLCDQMCVWIDRHAAFDDVQRPVMQADKSQGLDSQLAHLMRSGRFVRVCEIHAPRPGMLGHFVERARRLKPWFDAMNVTGQLKGRDVLPSSEAAGHLCAIGVEAIAVLSGRDCDMTHLLTELAVMRCSEVNNVVCLSGDGGSRASGQVQLDSTAMLRVAGAQALLRRMWLGAVINPFSKPATLPIDRLKQKIASGADFLQTQMVFDVPAFADFCDAMVKDHLHEKAHLLAGVPVVVSEQGLALAQRLPGVWMPESISKCLRETPDMVACGLALARETIAAMRQMPGVAGVHLMLLGSDDESMLIDAVK